MLLAWPHILVTDVPLVFGTAGLNAPDSHKETRALVSYNPPPLFPAGAFGVWYKWDDIGPNLRNAMPENRFAARANLVMNHLMMGGMFKSNEEKSRRNSQMVLKAAEYLSSGGNLAIWPSGPDMIGRWHKGAARILLSALMLGKDVDVVYCHTSTFAGPVLRGLVGKARVPAILYYRHGPSASEVRSVLAQEGVDALEAADDYTSFSMKVTPFLHDYLQKRFFDQQHDFLAEVACRYGGNWRTERLRSFYAQFAPKQEELDKARVLLMQPSVSR